MCRHQDFLDHGCLTGWCGPLSEFMQSWWWNPNPLFIKLCVFFMVRVLGQQSVTRRVFYKYFLSAFCQASWQCMCLVFSLTMSHTEQKCLILMKSVSWILSSVDHTTPAVCQNSSSNPQVIWDDLQIAACCPSTSAHSDGSLSARICASGCVAQGLWVSLPLVPFLCTFHRSQVNL